MDTRRLSYLLELSREGSMRGVSDLLGVSTSTISQQLALLAEEVGVELLVREGRGVRLTPAGMRLAEHAERILTAVDAARCDLDPYAEPSGTVRVAGFASALRRTVLPVVRELADRDSGVRIAIREYEPAEALALLAHDRIDIALNYDYDLAPAQQQRGLHTTPLWETPWGLGVPSEAAAAFTAAHARLAPSTVTSAQVLHWFRDARWIGNSRNSADESALRVLASVAGFELAVTHEADHLSLVDDLIVNGLGVGLLPMDRALHPGVAVLPLRDPGLKLRAFAQTRSGLESWPALAHVRERISWYAARVA